METVLQFSLSKRETRKERNYVISLNLYFQHHPNIFIVVSILLKAEIVSSEKTASL